MPISSQHLIVPLGRPMTKQFMCFTAMGAVSTAAHYAILVALVHMMAADPVAASIGGFVAGAFVNYVANYHVTFQSKKRHEEAIIKFLSVALLGLGLNTLIMAFATNLVGLAAAPTGRRTGQSARSTKVARRVHFSTNC